MMKKIIIYLCLFTSSMIYSQVGINTTVPKATFDVVATPADATKIDGFIPPRLTGNELKGKDALYTTAQTGTIIYATLAANPISTKTVNVTSAGYYYFDGIIWQKMSSSSTTEPWYNQATGTQATTNTQNIYQMGNVGINTIAPAAHLNVKGTNNQPATSGTATNAIVRIEGSTQHALDIGTFSVLPFGSYLQSVNKADLSTIGNLPLILNPNSGNVGIGTTSPSETLDVGTGNLRVRTINTNSGTSADKVVVVDGTGVLKTVAQSNLSVEPWYNQATGAQATTNTQNIYQMGNVGIGTSTPTSRLDVKGNQSLDASATAAQSKNVLDINIGQDGFSFGNRTENFGINMKTSSTAFSGSIARINFGDVSAASMLGPRYLSFSVGRTPNELMYLTDANSGRVGISTISPSETLDIGAGNVRIRAINTNAGTSSDNVVVVDGTGVLKTVAQSNLGIEPWFVIGGTNAASSNTENIYHVGQVAIGTNAMFGSSGEKLAVNGTIRTANSVYADYVFDDYFTGKSLIKEDYKFKSLKEVEDYIKEKKHLPGVTSIKDLIKTEEGYSFNLTELSIQSLEKLEELYLHVIEQQKQIEAKNDEIENLKKNGEEMMSRLLKLENILSKR